MSAVSFKMKSARADHGAGKWLTRQDESENLYDDLLPPFFRVLGLRGMPDVGFSLSSASIARAKMVAISSRIFFESYTRGGACAVEEHTKIFRVAEIAPRRLCIAAL